MRTAEGPVANFGNYDSDWLDFYSLVLEDEGWSIPEVHALSDEETT